MEGGGAKMTFTSTDNIFDECVYPCPLVDKFHVLPKVKSWTRHCT